MQSLLQFFTWSRETSLGIGGLLHAGLLHVGATNATAGVDRGQWPHPHSTNRWSHHHQDHPGRRCPGHRCHRSMWTTTQEHKFTAGWATEGHHSIHGGKEPLQQKKKGSNQRWNPWYRAWLISRSVTSRLQPTTEQIHHHPHRTWQTLTLTCQAPVHYHGSHHSATGSSTGWFSYPPQPGPNQPSATQAPWPMCILRTRRYGESGSVTRNREMGRGWGWERWQAPHRSGMGGGGGG
jgi:hypothetical protein